MVSEPQRSNIYTIERSTAQHDGHVVRIAEDGTKTNVAIEDDDYNEVEMIAVDAQGNIYAAIDDKIVKYDAAGVEKWRNNELVDSGPSWVYGLALDIHGNVFVSDGARSCVAKINSDGALAWKKTDGQEYTDYNYYTVAVDLNGDVIVARTSSDNTVITKENGSTGEDVWSYTEAKVFRKGTAAVAVDLQGNIYTPYITKLDSAGNKVWRYTFDYASVTTDVYGNMYACKGGLLVKKDAENASNQFYISKSSVGDDDVVVDMKYNVYTSDKYASICKFVQNGDSILYYKDDKETEIRCRKAKKNGTDWYARSL